MKNRCERPQPAIKRRYIKASEPIVEFPKPEPGPWSDPPTLASALRLHMNRHGDTVALLYRAVVRPDDSVTENMLRGWLYDTVPKKPSSFEILRRIEQRYRLPENYFALRCRVRGRPSAGPLSRFTRSQYFRAKWHIPDDFLLRSSAEQSEIADWIYQTIIVGGTQYRYYNLTSREIPYTMRFPICQSLLDPAIPREKPATRPTKCERAPEHLIQEIAAFLRFKTALLTPLGLKRGGPWNEATSIYFLSRFSQLFGALALAKHGKVPGLGVPTGDLSLALLVVPQILDWYSNWRKSRRSFFTKAEVDFAKLVRALTDAETGWLTQNPELALSLHPIPGVLEPEEIAAIRHDWMAACERMNDIASTRCRDLDRISRVHRDPFEPIHPIIASASPVEEYRRIVHEIIAWMPSVREKPIETAEAVRGVLMLRFGLHLGLRQRNLRELLICLPTEAPTPVVTLEAMRRGELRWNRVNATWEFFAPPCAFKNARSSFFSKFPFQMTLPDVDGLYHWIDEYLSVHRSRLLAHAKDTRTFFVRTARLSQSRAEFTSTTFYAEWREIIERFGVYNPYTKRGAIEGLLPHGPHSVRDVLATHILKKTGSAILASYAIQDVPETVEKHYARFLPEEKARMAASVLADAWV